ncbi:glutathione S-transferase family protein [Bosea caraganae]|uniref:Glutathione S-transferase family protein n=1 Tax=Bosea caraganae TaxID=2763117 RepID=A0A370LCI4_9HYPH|nr:glutathione S-transferase family protein [Bosea caraganae]RDJ27554.1 glutathione S-transferase family protein [Bosea caraganae]RDJ29569.1 glutathione S-transferase family protein [Bosea caraganae]
MLTIWGRISSINVQKAVWAAGEVGQTFERIDVGGAFGGTSGPTYRAKNPNGLVPVLEDGEICIWESNSIVRYLAARYGAGWIWEEDPALRAESDRWMDWMIAELQPALNPGFRMLLRTPPEQRDPAVVENAIARTEALMAILDAHLAQRSYLANERFGMADITVAPGAHRWLNLPVQRTKRPHVERWYEMVSARPAAKPALPVPIS